MTKEQRSAWRKANPEKHRAEQRKHYAKHKLAEQRRASKSKKKNPISIRRRRLKLANWTLELYDKVFEEQKGLCWICGTTLNHDIKLNSNRACADHDHVRKIPRGILCAMCNPMLGFARDNVRTLEMAVSYLKKFSS